MRFVIIALGAIGLAAAPAAAGTSFFMRVPVAPVVPSAPAGPPAMTGQCGVEGGRCDFVGTYAITYGADGHFVTRTFTNSIYCNNGVFGGDPIVGTVKACYFS